MTARDDFARNLREAAAKTDAAIAGLTDEQASGRAGDGWSVKDHVTHLTVWHEFRFFEISRIARGGRGIVPTFNDEIDSFNETFAATRRHLPLPQVIADLNFAREMVLKAIAEAPEDALDSRHYLEASPAGGAAHETEHADHISAWRGREGV
jgi:hypothetical protein